MGEQEGHNRWSRIRPSWVRRMAEEPKDAKGPGEAEKAPVPEKKLGEGEKKIETPRAVEGAVEGKEKAPPRLEDVERELEAEKEKTKKMEEMLERQREGETSRVAEMAQRLAAETERQQKLARELQQPTVLDATGWDATDGDACAANELDGSSARDGVQLWTTSTSCSTSWSSSWSSCTRWKCRSTAKVVQLFKVAKLFQVVKLHKVAKYRRVQEEPRSRRL